jgi:hypothetical protein
MLSTPRTLISAALIVLFACTSISSPHPASAAANERCFPETSQCLSGRFRQFWEQNGGLPVFGYPITAMTEVAGSSATDAAHPPAAYLVQWFERARFELHPENAIPYQVLLGRLGDEQLRATGVDWQTLPRAAGPKPGCLWFEQTGHNICDQAAGRGFKTTWIQSPLKDFPATYVPDFLPYIRNLAFMGLPLTEATMEVNAADGQMYLTQWFERARLEWHPEQPERYRVLFGLLGRELGDQSAPAVFPPQTVAYRWPTQLPKQLTILPADFAHVTDHGEILALGNTAGVQAYLSAGAYAGGSSYVTSDGRPALATPIVVRGQPGFSYVIPHGNLIDWQEDATSYAISSPYNISVDDLVALANALEAVDRATLQQRLAQR